MTEQEILEFWKKDDTFRKSLERRKDSPRFVFWEGPPSANGRPGLHHVLARVFKDVVCRYKTMRGFLVERKAGWDTHGLPIELEAEKRLRISGKKQIETLKENKFESVKFFNEECRKSVWTYKEEWEKLTERIGYWLDMADPYITYDNKYIESVWWTIKEADKKGLLYEGYRVVPYCPRCQTPLATHEVAQGYKLVRDPSVFVKFKIKKDSLGKLGKDIKGDAYFLVWTTTPWTLPANVALAVNPKQEYYIATIEKIDGANNNLAEGDTYIFARGVDTESRIFGDRLHIHPDDFKKGDMNAGINKTHILWKDINFYEGKDIIGLEYEQLFPYSKPDKPAFRVVGGDFVTTTEGTGVVHVAPAFGADDMEAARKNDLPVILNVDDEGKFKEEVAPWAGRFVKAADEEIIKTLKENGALFNLYDVEYKHDYPHCWRCDSPLLYYARDSWFIKMSELREELLASNKKINWVPAHLKEGRFGEWLENIKDWGVSRSRYWGTPLPIWKCQRIKSQIPNPKSQINSNPSVGGQNPKNKTADCENVKVVGSIQELRELSGADLPDLHRPFIDEIVFPCEKCGGEMRRIEDVCDVWLDSGAMPYAQWHYPRENKEKIDKGESFPADYIAEAVDQTRGWFYTLLAVSTFLDLPAARQGRKEPPYKNVISAGHVLDKTGKKMSKSRGNVVDPWEMTEKYGADAVRWYFFTVNDAGDPKLFDERDLAKHTRGILRVLKNSFIFWNTYAEKNPKSPPAGQAGGIRNPKHILDKWILSYWNSALKMTKEDLDNYNIVSAARRLEKFSYYFSNWYIRRSRDRFQNPASPEDLREASATFYFILTELSKAIAPFMPFVSEEIFRDLGNKESVHLENYPEVREKFIDKDIEAKMKLVREAAALGQGLRHGKVHKGKIIKVRQPLARAVITKDLGEDYHNILAGELNVEKITVEKIPEGWEYLDYKTPDFQLQISLDPAKISEELYKKWWIREIIRHIQSLRKRAGFQPGEPAKVGLVADSEELKKVLAENKEEISRKTKSEVVFENVGGGGDKVSIDGIELKISIVR